MSFLDDLNPHQREAVEATEGPVLILAGAGSGKTRVITYRIAYLIEHLGVMPESILAMTFTNKAAGEMAERVEKLVGGLSIAKPVISTFHSFCVRVLRKNVEALRIPSSVPGQPPIGLTKNFVIYDEADQQQVVKGVMRRLGLDDKQLTPRTVQSRISWAKNHMLDPQEIYLQSADPKSERIAHIFEEYRKELRKANAMDFDDLLLEAMRLLKALPAVREYYNRRFQYILVDEYQDTNRPQYELMRLLAGDRHNVCAVGDEDQSIYSWRGADIRNILEFERDFPEAKIVRLEQNYRSNAEPSWARPRRWWRTTSGAKGRICGPRARAERRSATTKRPTARTKRCLPPTPSTAMCKTRSKVVRTPVPRSSTGRTRNRACLKKPCAATS